MQTVKIPFLNQQRRNSQGDKNYFYMLKNNFFPHFQAFSISTFLILANIIVFITIHILYSPSQFNHFLQWPQKMDKFLLDTALIKKQKKYLYQLFTSIFLHNSYLHIVGNIIFAFFIMYEMERCWRPSILWGLVGGIAAQCLVLASLDGKFLGFSGVLCCYFGIFLGTVFVHCSYLQQRYRQNFWMVVLFVVLNGFMLLGFTSQALVHLYGFTFGILLGVAVYPKVRNYELSDSMDKIFKAIAAGCIFLVVMLAIFL